MRTLYIIRGLPGSGKTTVAHRLADVCFAADDYMLNKNGDYEFNPAKLRDAHESCQRAVMDAAIRGVERIAVHNTFSQKWEAKPYIGIAEHYGYEVFVLECQNEFKNTHGVPDSTMLAMARRWEPVR